MDINPPLMSKNVTKTTKKQTKNQTQPRPKISKHDKQNKGPLDNFSLINTQNKIMGTNLKEVKKTFAPDDFEININSIEKSLAIP